jgi:hypothetical protein
MAAMMRALRDAHVMIPSRMQEDDNPELGEYRRCWGIQKVLGNAEGAGECRRCWGMQKVLGNAEGAGEYRRCWGIQKVLGNAEGAGSGPVANVSTGVSV